MQIHPIYIWNIDNVPRFAKSDSIHHIQFMRKVSIDNFIWIRDKIIHLNHYTLYPQPFMIQYLDIIHQLYFSLTTLDIEISHFEWLDIWSIVIWMNRHTRVHGLEDHPLKFFSPRNTPRPLTSITPNTPQASEVIHGREIVASPIYTYKWQ